MSLLINPADIRDRVGISKTELVSMLEEEELKDAVLVVLANKQVIIQKSHMPVRVGQSNLKKKILLNT